MEKLRHEQSNLGRGVQPGNPGLGCKLRPALGLEHPQRGDRRLPAQGAAGPGAFQPERRCPAAAEDGAGVLLHGVPTEPAADERHGDPARQDPLLRGTEAAGLAGGDLGLLFQRRAAHPAGGLLPGAGQGAVGAPAGPAALSEHHHPGREARGCAGPGPRPCAPRHRANAAGAAGGARVPGRDEGLPAPGDTDPEGGVALPGHLRPLLWRGGLHTLLHPGEALPAALPLGGRPGQEPGGALQELQHAAAEPRGGARGRGRGGGRRGDPAALGLRDDVLPRAPGLRRHARPGARWCLWHLPVVAPVGTLPQQTVPAGPAPQAWPGCGPRLPCLFQPREPGRPDPGVGRLGFRGDLH
ncbi:proline-rich protein 5 isoform X4 [Ovis aries]|uniref:proline-rich protein 5 isoform X4 n=1 Tax=Ovis aries TaxID=9940 RepID=UPI00295286E3|nr:proline-rich protein 5 isoform X4 [Ovis aries]